ncbi:hypothetical protein [Flavobacterium sp. 3HN19-14]|uniref:hypothetical protein n=1 Tax=Flavobacterium sp. 3HN19-14 TaxID=3448133 RepID=UPI003EDE87F1
MKVTCSGSDAYTNASLVSPINCSFDITKSSSSYVSIAGTGSSLTGTWRNGNTNTDDNLSASQNIGFNFPYKGGNYSTFSVSTNGYLTFNTGTSATGSGLSAYGYDNSYFTNTSGTLLSLAPYYEDLVTPGNPGNIAGLNAAFKYALNGTAPNRVATIEWIGMETFNNA